MVAGPGPRGAEATLGATASPLGQNSILLGFRLQKPGIGHLLSKRALSAFLAHDLLNKSLIRCSDYLQDNLSHSACKVQAGSYL
jgi:hypothetical protein